VEDALPLPNSTYNLACVCALLGRFDECKGFMSLAVKDGTMPSQLYVQHDPDLAAAKDEPWFRSFLPSSGLSASKNPKTSPAASVVDRSELLKSQIAPIIEPAKVAKVEKTHAEAPRYSEDSMLNAAIVYDEDLNRLQSSLLREGFSISSAMGMVLEVGKEKHKKLDDDKNLRENRNRLHARIKKAGLREKREIPGDGNCQFVAVSDQLFDNLRYGDYVREEAVKWLRSHKDWALPNGALLWHFAYDQTWDAFCDELSRRGIWGNHLTLVAIAENFGVRIRIISSVQGDNYITEVNPSALKTSKIAWISHYAEFHYGSLAPLS